MTKTPIIGLFQPNNLLPTFTADSSFRPVRIKIGGQAVAPCGASVTVTLEFADGSYCEILLPNATAQEMGHRLSAANWTGSKSEIGVDFEMPSDPKRWNIEAMNA